MRVFKGRAGGGIRDRVGSFNVGADVRRCQQYTVIGFVFFLVFLAGL